VRTDLRWTDLPVVSSARDHVVERLRERETRRARAAYDAAVARRERARRRPRRQLLTRLTAAGGLVGGALLPMTVAPVDPVLYVASGAALMAAAVLPRREPAAHDLPALPLLPPPLLPAGSPEDAMVRRAHGAAGALRAMAAAAPAAAQPTLAAAAAEAEECLPEFYALAERHAAVRAGRSRVEDPATAVALDAAAGSLLGRLGGAVLAVERLCSSAAGALGAEAEHWSFEVERLEAATHDLGAMADGLRETAAAEERRGLR
jgi:hypothetical protein